MFFSILNRYIVLSGVILSNDISHTLSSLKISLNNLIYTLSWSSCDCSSRIV